MTSAEYGNFLPGFSAGLLQGSGAYYGVREEGIRYAIMGKGAQGRENIFSELKYSVPRIDEGYQAGVKFKSQHKTKVPK